METRPLDSGQLTALLLERYFYPGVLGDGSSLGWRLRRNYLWF